MEATIDASSQNSALLFPLLPIHRLTFLQEWLIDNRTLRKSKKPSSDCLQILKSVIKEIDLLFGCSFGLGNQKNPATL
jgi:hypothetical protein